ncbi:MAG TPA: hypothetical protein VJB90_01675 [Candidatus Nanoarchaeia archaeon]|nr:hypothetical protein [Candidatus Nanoarchaeia archaeon]
MAYVDNQRYMGSYSNAFDRNYEIIDPTAEIGIERFDVKDENFEGEPMGADFGFKISELGVSTPPFKDQLEALKSRIFQGASKIELGFMGQQKGSAQQGQYTPESYGFEERRDIRELARLNKIELSSHAALHSNSLAGYAQGGFDERSREGSLFEIQKAIEFAGDTQKGGAVVFHLSEFPRPVSEWYGDQGFKAYPLEPVKAPLLLVDTRTGRLIDQVRKDVQIVTPEWERDENRKWKLDDEGNRIPVWIADKWENVQQNGRTIRKFTPGHFDVRLRKFDYFEDEAKEWNKEYPDQIRTPAQQQFFDRLDMQVAQSKAFAKIRESSYEESLEGVKRVEEALNFYEKIEKNVPEDELWKLKQQASSLVHRYAPSSLVPTEQKLPSEILKDALRGLKNNVDDARAFVGYVAQAEEQAKTKDFTVPIEKYAVQKTADTIARAGIHAMQRTEFMKRQPFNKNVKIDPLFVGVENAHVPDMWGAHPQELKQAILESRKQMAEILKHQGYKEEEAKKFAENHIKATVDIGHANTWKKFFQGDPNLTIEENDKRFKRWLIGQMDDLIENKIIGHVHITDNFGFDDEHLVPGTGNAPIKEFLDKVKKLNPSLIIEPAHQDFRATLGGWKRFGQGIYGLPRRDTDTWADVEHSYFGKPAPPYFLFGESAPDPEAWQLWSQTRME